MNAHSIFYYNIYCNDAETSLNRYGGDHHAALCIVYILNAHGDHHTHLECRNHPRILLMLSTR